MYYWAGIVVIMHHLTTDIKSSQYFAGGGDDAAAVWAGIVELMHHLTTDLARERAWRRIRPDLTSKVRGEVCGEVCGEVRQRGLWRTSTDAALGGLRLDLARASARIHTGEKMRPPQCII